MDEVKALIGPARASEKMSAENLFIAYLVIIENHSVDTKYMTIKDRC